MVATALIILSTFGLEIVEPMYIEFMVDDFLISMSSSSFEFILFILLVNISNKLKANYIL